MTTNNLFPSFLDTTSSTNNQNIIGNVPRLAPSPLNGSQQVQSNPNGNNISAIHGLPMAAGTQMDVNYLFQKVVELSEVLKENREKTESIVGAAEQLAVCGLNSQQIFRVLSDPLQTRAAASGADPSLHETNAELSGT